MNSNASSIRAYGMNAEASKSNAKKEEKQKYTKTKYEEAIPEEEAVDVLGEFLNRVSHQDHSTSSSSNSQ